MATFFVVTQAPAGPRGRTITEKWIVIASNPMAAEAAAVKGAHPGAIRHPMFEVEEVTEIKRVAAL